MIETQIAQLVAAAPISEPGKIPGQPENVSVVSIRWEPRHPNHAERPWFQGNNWDEPAIEEEDPGYLAISCSLWDYHIKQALCDLGASINIMPMAVCEAINLSAYVMPTSIRVQLADSTIRCPEGIIRNIPVKIQGDYVFADFVVLVDGC